MFGFSCISVMKAVFHHWNRAAGLLRPPETIDTLWKWAISFLQSPQCVRPWSWQPSMAEWYPSPWAPVNKHRASPESPRWSQSTVWIEHQSVTDQKKDHTPIAHLIVLSILSSSNLSHSLIHLFSFSPSLIHLRSSLPFAKLQTGWWAQDNIPHQALPSRTNKFWGGPPRRMSQLHIQPFLKSFNNSSCSTTQSYSDTSN